MRLLARATLLVALCSCDDTQAPATTTTTSIQTGEDAGVPGSAGTQGNGGSPPSTAMPSVPPATCPASCDDDTDASRCPVEEPLDADLESIADVWGADDTCGTRIISTVIGECADGTDFVFHSTGHTSEVRYFSGGQFVALATTTDSIDRTCLGQTYWPSFVTCQQPVVREVLCGNSEVGDSVALPWSEEITSSREAFFRR